MPRHRVHGRLLSSWSSILSRRTNQSWWRGHLRGNHQVSMTQADFHARAGSWKRQGLRNGRITQNARTAQWRCASTNVWRCTRTNVSARPSTIEPQACEETSMTVVLITGALTGIGRATALAFAKEGDQIVVSGRHRHTGAELVEELRSLGAEDEFIC